MKKITQLFLLLPTLFTLLICQTIYADVIINVLAVNGTSEARTKEIKQLLPKELKLDDITDAAGLEIKYDVDNGCYAVVGSIELGPKESKTLRVRVRDVWMIQPQNIQEIKEQIDNNYAEVAEGEFGEAAAIKKDSLIKRLDSIVLAQEESADNTGKRIDRYRVNEKELSDIRNNAVSVKYWRSKPPSVEETAVFRLVLEAENPSSTKVKKSEQTHYLPKEVKPEHILEAEGFEIKYDSLKGQSYLWREEELQPKEKKRYEISILDIWKINQQNIENFRDRTRETYRLLEKTEYVKNADFLVASIKGNLEGIEATQARESDIAQHIMDYRSNLVRYDQAKNDVQALDELLEVVRERLVRSRLENMLAKIKSLKNVSDISKALFEGTALQNEGGKTILGVIIGIGAIILIAFIYFLTRSKSVVIKDSPEGAANKEEAKV
ncbi:MAG: hypothetical protein KBD53_05805 [Candidatus Omnitrophica bacterium]|nr:hypothetical protein [Candidatus Omnitrophota bacterium]